MPGREIFFYDSIDSTNTALKNNREAKGGALAVAAHQSAGRGRTGKSFFSPAGAGVYFSINLEKRIPLGRAWALTFFAAAAVALTLEEYGAEPTIKWVNDIYAGGKKLCGILTETEREGDFVTRAIIGIGINIKKVQLPPELESIVTSLEAQGICPDENELVCKIVTTFEELVGSYDIPAVLAEYRKRDFLLGKKISYTYSGGIYAGTAQGIADDGTLTVKTTDGIKHLSSGEVSIKAKE